MTALVLAELGSPYQQHNRWDFSKDNDQLFARELEEDGDAVERAFPRTHFLWLDTEESSGEVFWAEAKDLR